MESTSLLLGVVLLLVFIVLFPFSLESFTCFAALLDEIDNLQRIASDETVNVSGDAHGTLQAGHSIVEGDRVERIGSFGHIGNNILVIQLHEIGGLLSLLKVNGRGDGEGASSDESDSHVQGVCDFFCRN